MRSIHTAVLKFEIAVPPGSAAALAPQIGSRYQVAPAKGLSTLPLLVEVVLELDELELLEDEELLLDEELEELLDEEELELEELEELLLDDEEELLEEVELLPLIEPAEAVRVTRSSLAPSSRLTIRSVCEPAARLLKVAGVIVA
jgi:hypothetical protein